MAAFATADSTNQNERVWMKVRRETQAEQESFCGSGAGEVWPEASGSMDQPGRSSFCRIESAYIRSLRQQTGAIMILRTTLILSTLAFGVTGADAKAASRKAESSKVESTKVAPFTHSGGRHSDSHRHFQRWDHPHTGLARHSGSNHPQGYVRNSGPRFHGPHRDW